MMVIKEIDVFTVNWMELVQDRDNLRAQIITSL
jgi:hypothetical protein